LAHRGLQATDIGPRALTTNGTPPRREFRLDVQISRPGWKIGFIDRIRFGLLPLHQLAALIGALAAASRTEPGGAATGLWLEAMVAPFATATGSHFVTLHTT
jgi:hypothetical protein